MARLLKLASVYKPFPLYLLNFLVGTVALAFLAREGAELLGVDDLRVTVEDILLIEMYG